MTTRVRRGVSDPARFEGNGISYKAKLIGIEDVKEARGDLMCQEALIKLKNGVRISGEHKKKIFVNVTLDGLKIIDAISLASNQNKKKNEPKSPKLGEGSESTEQRPDLIVLHSHPVHRISFISRDTTDNRAFGYVFGTEDGLHKFFAIKTATAAEHLVLSLRDLFQVVYEMKKNEMEVAKDKLDKGEITTTVTTTVTPTTTTVAKENFQSPWAGSTSGTSQTPNPVQKVNVDTENIYQVPPNNAPVKPETHAEQVANLLDLEDQAEHILKGIEQIKNLDFDSATSDPFLSTAPSPGARPSPSVGLSDDAWGFYSTPPANPSPAVGNMGGFQGAQFPTMGQQSFPSTNFSMQNGAGGSLGFNMMNSGLPLTKDPFSSDPFGPQQARIAPSAGFGVGSAYHQPFGVPQPRLNIMGSPGMANPGTMHGMVPRGMMSPPVMGGIRSPFGVQPSPGFQMTNPFGNDSANILQPMKKDAGLDPNAANHEPVKTPPKSREDLFGDLLEIKKSSTAMSAKDLFAQKNVHERKPMNEMLGPNKTSSVPASQASGVGSDPFGDSDSIILDKTRGLLLSASREDPFDTSHIPHVLAESLPHPSPSIKSASGCTTPPPVPSRNISAHSHTDTLMSSPMPSCPPPPPPTLFNQPTPPLPNRSVPKPGLKTDINENINPASLNASSSSTDDFNFVCDLNTSFILPPPDDPPPLLPSHLAIQPSSLPPPSPTTPRPNVKFVHTLYNVSHSKAGDNSHGVKVISKASNLSDIPPQSINTTVNDISLKSHNANYLDISKDKNCDTTVTSNCQASENCVLENCSSLTEMSCPQNESKSRQAVKLKSDKLGWVGFENCKNLPENDCRFGLPNVSVSDDDAFEDDPFNMPLHLAPGFKAVAKFGSDPFDDTLSGPFSNDAWQPFAAVDRDSNEVNHDSHLNSPFGDVFVASNQQAASKSLFD